MKKHKLTRAEMDSPELKGARVEELNLEVEIIRLNESLQKLWRQMDIIENGIRIGETKP